MRDQKEVTALIDRIKEHNTRQRMAAESNKPIIAKIQECLSRLETLDLSSSELKDYHTKITQVIKLTEDLLDGDLFDNYSEKVDTKSKLIASLDTLVETMFTQMEAKLNEFQL